MLKVLIVDDDFPVRMLIKQIINWEKEGFHLIGEAIDGEEALNKIQDLNPDIIIVDIGMPIMNGIDLIKEIKRRGYICKIIVLSCHDEFEFVKEALKYGASEYILKNIIDKEKLLNVLWNVKNEIQKELMEKKEFYKIKRWANKGLWAMKQQALKQILQGVIKNEKAILEKINELELNISTSVNIIIAVEIDNYESVIYKIFGNEDKELFNFSIRNIIEEILNDILKGEVIDFKDKNFAIICNLENIKSEMQMKKIANVLTNKIKDSINKYLDVSTSIGISEKCSILNLYKCYEKAKAALKMKFYKGKNKIFYFTNIQHFSENAVELTKDQSNTIKTYIKENKINKLEEIIKFSIEKSKKDLIKPEYVYNFWIEFYMIINKVCQQYNTSIEEICDKKEPYYKIIQSQETIYELEKILIIFIEKLNKYFQIKKANNINNEIIREIINYIQCNYMKDITLYTAAEYVHMNMAYVSHLFKQEMGENFTEYLKRLRIEKAKHLIETTDKKVSKIAEKVGFGSRKYFSKIFKEIEGISPSDYKKQKNLS